MYKPLVVAVGAEVAQLGPLERVERGVVSQRLPPLQDRLLASERVLDRFLDVKVPVLEVEARVEPPLEHVDLSEPGGDDDDLLVVVQAQARPFPPVE